MTKKVAVVGSYNVDMTITTERFPLPGETVIGDALNRGHGGKGANQAVAAARAGASVSFLAKVGQDQFGQEAKTCLSGEGINTDAVILDDSGEPTGTAFITVNHEGENSIVVISGANWALSSKDILAQSAVIKTADVLLTQLEIRLPSVTKAIQIASENNVKVILNPAPAQYLGSDILKHVNILTPNRGEAEILSGIDLSDDTALPPAANALHKKGVEVVVITLGKEGAFVSGYGKQAILPSLAVEAIDTVGAGDVFSGVLAALYPSTADSLIASVRLAIIASGLSVQRVGAQNSIPSLAEIKSYRNDSVLVESQ